MTIKSRLLSSTKEQARDTGLALILICLLIAYLGFSEPESKVLITIKEFLTSYLGNLSCFVSVAIVFLLLTMIWPDIFRPAAWFWFGLSHFMGTIVSSILLSVLFFLLVTPVGFIRRLAGADSLQLRSWKKNSDSVFKVRDHKFLAADIEKPF